MKLQILKLIDLYSYEVNAKLMHKHTRNKLRLSLFTFFVPDKAIHTKYSFSIIRIKSLPAQIQISKITKKFQVSGSQDMELGATRQKQLLFNRFKIKYKNYFLFIYN